MCVTGKPEVDHLSKEQETPQKKTKKKKHPTQKNKRNKKKQEREEREEGFLGFWVLGEAFSVFVPRGRGELLPALSHSKDRAQHTKHTEHVFCVTFLLVTTSSSKEPRHADSFFGGRQSRPERRTKSPVTKVTFKSPRSRLSASAPQRPRYFVTLASQREKEGRRI